MFIEDDDVLRKPGVVRSVYDPKAGTGGILKWSKATLLIYAGIWEALSRSRPGR